MPKRQKDHILTLLEALMAWIILWFLLFPVANLIGDYISKRLGVPSLEGFVVMDAVLSFVLLCSFFLVILLVQKRHPKFVVWFCAVAMFLYWGFESEFFWKGFNPMYPVWFEINMALNDLVAAALTIFLHNRATASKIEPL